MPAFQCEFNISMLRKFASNSNTYFLKKKLIKTKNLFCKFVVRHNADVNLIEFFFAREKKNSYLTINVKLLILAYTSIF